MNSNFEHELNYHIKYADYSDAEQLEFLDIIIPTLQIIDVNGDGVNSKLNVVGMIDGYAMLFSVYNGLAGLYINYTMNNIENPLYSSFEKVESTRSINKGYWVDSLINLFPKLHRREFVYSFPYAGIEFDDFNDPTTVHSAEFDETLYKNKNNNCVCMMGESVDDALNNILDYNSNDFAALHGTFTPYFDDRDINSWSEETKLQVYNAIVSTMIPIPMQTDERKYPEKEPMFIMNIPSSWRSANRIITPWISE